MSKINRMRPKEESEKALGLRKKCGEEFYNEHNKLFVEITCPACGHKGESIFIVFGFRHRLCPDCMTIWCSPRPTKELLIDYYTYSEATKYWTQLLIQTNSERKTLQCKPRADYIINQIVRHRGCDKHLSLAVDLGAGSGAFALALKHTKFFENILAVDFDEDCCRACNDLGLDVKQGSVDVLEDNSVDLMVMNDMIEHLFDPTEFLLQCNKKLTNNGYIAIACPNGQGFDFQLMKEKTVNICPPEHLNYFNVHSLPLLLGSAGFNVVSAETPGILDADIVKRGLEDGSFCMDDNMFLKNLLLSSSEETLTCFQEFLSTNKLSSHMLVIANKTISQGRN